MHDLSNWGRLDAGNGWRTICRHMKHGGGEGDQGLAVDGRKQKDTSTRGRIWLAARVYIADTPTHACSGGTAFHPACCPCARERSSREGPLSNRPRDTGQTRPIRLIQTSHVSQPRALRDRLQPLGKPSRRNDWPFIQPASRAACSSPRCACKHGSEMPVSDSAALLLCML